jgi:hypothetical protein
MTTGLFGPRHIHKRVLDLPIPVYDSDDELHRRLALLGARLSSQAAISAPQAVGERNARKRVRDSLDRGDLDHVEQLAANLFKTAAEN